MKLYPILALRTLLCHFSCVFLDLSLSFLKLRLITCQMQNLVH